MGTETLMLSSPSQDEPLRSPLIRTSRGVSSASASQDFSFWRPPRAPSHTSLGATVPVGGTCQQKLSWGHHSWRPAGIPGRDLLDKLTPVCSIKGCLGVVPHGMCDLSGGSGPWKGSGPCPDVHGVCGCSDCRFLPAPALFPSELSGGSC